jgi:uncharacterized tellurite resistance protein B-like protein
MSILNLASVLKIFGGSEPTEEERAKLREEVMLMVLARATAADLNISSVEIDTVRETIREKTGSELTDAEIRVAANSELFEKAPLKRYVASASKNLEHGERVEIIQALAQVIHSDDRTGAREAEYFQQMVEAMQLGPDDVAGLLEN